MGNVPSVPGIYGPLGVCVVASLSPRWGLFSFPFLPTACAVGCILTPLRGSTELAGPLLGRRSSYDTDSWDERMPFVEERTLQRRVGHASNKMGFSRGGWFPRRDYGRRTPRLKPSPI